MAVVGPRHPHSRAGRDVATGLAAAAGGWLVRHSASCAMVLSAASVLWGLQQVG